MKTKEEILADVIVGSGKFNLVAPTEEQLPLILEAMERYAEQKLNKLHIMQAEGSDGENGAAVASEGQGEANTCADAGCPKCKSTNLFDVDDHWTKCDDCGFTFVG